MQRLLQVFRRRQNAKPATAPTTVPVPVKPEDLKHVAGGLPAIGGLMVAAPPAESTKLI